MRTAESSSGGHKVMQQATLININLNRRTALERSVINYRGALTSFRRATSPSVTDVVQRFSLLFGSHDHPLTRQRIFTVNR